jgi:CheY-like chemotaxis protein
MNFPFVKQGTGSNSLDLAARLKHGTFLVVDDFDSMRKVTSNQLRQLGATRIVEAANGAEALKILTKQPITLVLSDWNMPVMSGLELLLSVRSNAQLFAMPFLMITAEAERDRVTQAIHAGVSELLVKPYTSGRFSERLEKALDWKPRQNRPIDPAAAMAGTGLKVKSSGSVGSSIAPEPSAVPPAPTFVPEKKADRNERPTILVVDDTPDNLHLLSSLFKDEYRVKIAHHGEKALQICHSDTPPDLILLDIMMPGMDGFQVAQALRGHPSSEHIPVIFVTAMTDEATRLKGMELGAVDFVTKPIDPDALKVRVRYVELHSQLQADYDEIMAAEKMKQDVEAITRHDMKAPLSGVLGLIQSLADGPNLSDDQRDMLRMAEEAALQTLNMINLSNELYKIETGRFQLKPAPVAVTQIVRRIAEMQRKAFAVKELKIAVATPNGYSDEDLVATGDSMLCYSLFQNLMKNACEAAPDGTTVTATIYPGSPRRITINNMGVVPAAIRDTFFDKFATAGKQGGTGIGTYSARLLAEAQNGDITMQTSDEKGSTVITVLLPSETVEEFKFDVQH